MKITLIRFLALVFLVLLALLADFLSLPGSQEILIAGVLIATVPLVIDIIKTFLKKQIDLGLPVYITLVILLVMRNLKSAAFFVLLILVGRFFKEYILWRVRESVASISKSLPRVALQKKGTEIDEVPISELKAGDILVVKAGGRVPVDGILLYKSGEFDESVATGESKSVQKNAGEQVIAGAISLSDYLELKAIDTSANSTLAQMQKLVEEAQSRNAPLSRFTTRYAEITSLVALLGVILLYLLFKNLQMTLAFWIALVPVIFAIIVPVATTLGIALLTKSGVLVKTAESLENLTQIDTLCFDKTGTLTQGRPQIVKVMPLNGYTEKSLMQMAASVERYSEHHLGIPIVEQAKQLQLAWMEVRDVHIDKGLGISAFHPEGKLIFLGNKEFMEIHDVTLPHEVLSEVQSWEASGATPIFVSLDRRLSGILFLADRLREESKPMLARLREMGFRLIMLTGDNAAVAERIGAEAGVAEVKAGLLPQGKIQAIQGLKKEGRRVLMVGDGINDAPALAEANVGVAMGLRGIEITMESAQIVLIKDDLSILPEMFRTAKKTFQIIRTDLFLATAIHLFAAGLVLFEVIGILGSTLFHQVSSTLVLANTMRLFRAHRKQK